MRNSEYQEQIIFCMKMHFKNIGNNNNDLNDFNN